MTLAAEAPASSAVKPPLRGGLPKCDLSHNKKLAFRRPSLRHRPEGLAFWLVSRENCFQTEWAADSAMPISANAGTT